MKNSTAKGKTVRYLLGILLLIVAVNAFAGGYNGMAGAEGVPLEWLDDSPFRSYLVPSLVLFFVVGGSCLFAAIAAFKGKKSARKAAIAAALVMLSWIGTQLVIIGYVSWLQPATVIAAILILMLATALRNTRL